MNYSFYDSLSLISIRFSWLPLHLSPHSFTASCWCVNNPDNFSQCDWVTNETADNRHARSAALSKSGAMTSVHRVSGTVRSIRRANGLAQVRRRWLEKSSENRIWRWTSQTPLECILARTGSMNSTQPLTVGFRYGRSTGATPSD
jgi:hypothetical protein